MSSGPYLYDDDPAPLHTGTPRRRQGLLIGVLVGTVLVAIGMVVALVALRGSGEEQATETAGVFLAALAQGDTDTAYQLLCQEEQARLQPDGIAPEYVRTEPGRVVGSAEDEVDGEPVQRVRIRWADGGESALTVVAENGARVCGTR